MKTEIFAVHDSAADAFAQPMFFKNTATSLRAFAAACRDENTDLHQHPSDYTLFKIGEFDEDSGKLTALEPVSVAKALDYRDAAPKLAANDG